MNSSKHILLVVGILAIVAGIYNLVQGDTNNALLAFISGASLVYGYTEMSKK